MALEGNRVGRSRGFTLVEIMIVVAIIGLVALIAIPALRRASMRAQNARFASDVRVAAGAFEMYAMENGNYPDDVSRGVVPAGMDPYLEKMDFTEETPLGGNWDWDGNVFGFVAAISAASPSASLEQQRMLDKMMDDNNLASGLLRSTGDRIMYIIEF